MPRLRAHRPAAPGRAAPPGRRSSSSSAPAAGEPAGGGASNGVPARWRRAATHRSTENSPIALPAQRDQVRPGAEPLAQVARNGADVGARTDRGSEGREVAVAAEQLDRVHHDRALRQLHLDPAPREPVAPLAPNVAGRDTRADAAAARPRTPRAPAESSRVGRPSDPTSPSPAPVRSSVAVVTPRRAVAR